MGTVEIRDHSIWLPHIEGDRKLRERIESMNAGDTLDLEIDGIVGRWERMRDGADGRPSLGIKPIADMKRVWAEMQKRRSEIVTIREVTTADAYLAASEGMLSEWNSPEDERAFSDL